MTAVDESAHPHRYVPPPAFAPPEARVPPLNEVQVAGRSTYPGHPAAMHPPSYPQYPAYAVPPAPARRSRHTAVVVAVGVVAAALVVAVVLLSGAAGPRAHTLTVPEAAGPYSKVSTIGGAQLRSILGGANTFANLAPQDLDNAKAGIYTRSTQATPSMLFIGFDAADSPTLGQQLRADNPADVAEQALLGAGSTSPPQSASAGPLGGALKLGRVMVDGDDATLGVWADSDTLGMVLVLDPVGNLTLNEVGEITREVRASAEH